MASATSTFHTIAIKASTIVCHRHPNTSPSTMVGGWWWAVGEMTSKWAQ
jgi:hypothetical protein